ncbi:hypothetical protein BOW37_12810 [Solemya velum gill symbiont]|uniref:hypothetical protein n=1 Tax=Solemya velum gill symbiont TaxID=2340 RepID=UPI00099803D5|nr:hypothetical protein [Solemya velum gill symbiont]OOZ42608.1 hypothetical protein BOW37_12810 [Solemya velum gill symbiont]
MNTLEYAALTYTEFASVVGYNLGIIVLGAIIGGIFKPVNYKMQRGAYYLNMMLAVFIGTALQAIWFFSLDALVNGYLILLAIFDFAVWLIVGFILVVLNKARSLDAFGTTGYAPLGFIPIANLWLLFKPSKEDYPSPKGLTHGIPAALLGIILFVGIRITSVWNNEIIEKYYTSNNNPSQAEIIRREFNFQVQLNRVG